MKKMQAELETLRSQNATLPKERTTGLSRPAASSKQTLQSVARRLDMDDVGDEQPHEEDGENEEPLNNEEEPTARRRKEHDDRGWGNKNRKAS